jgi:hypothetical protein
MPHNSPRIGRSSDDVEIEIGGDGVEEVVDASPPVRRMNVLSYADAAIAIGALLVAMWQLLEIDDLWIGFVLVWSAVPLLMVVARWFARTRAITLFAAVYLVLLGAGTAIAKAPAILPALSFEHPGDTEEAQTFNQLDVVSRRVIVWTMWQNVLILPAMLGYVLFFVPLRRRAPEDFSIATCLLGLFLLWGLSGISLLGAVLVPLAGG